jgi:hypothetical protein
VNLQELTAKVKELEGSATEATVTAALDGLGYKVEDVTPNHVHAIASRLKGGGIVPATPIAPTKSTKGRNSKISPVQEKVKEQAAKMPQLNMELIQQAAKEGFSSYDAIAAGQAYGAGFQARFSAEAAAGVAALTSNLGSFGRTDSDQVVTALQGITDGWTVEPEGKSLDFWE